MSGRNLNGILVVDKPENITSARVVAKVKHLTGANKVGHAGTLDPFATGVLVCCLNRATRIARFLLHDKKKYVAVLKLGEQTDTLDLTGTVVATAKSVAFSSKTIQNVFDTFKGIIWQEPPVFSALKHRGMPLYKLAREGKPVQKPPRRVRIYRLEIQAIDLPFIRFEVTCSGGTYVRALCADIGQTLGCGGHLHALRRIRSSGFTIDQAIPLADLETLTRNGRLAERVIGMAQALPDLPEFTANGELTKKIKCGQPLTPADLIKAGGDQPDFIRGSYTKIVDPQGTLIAILNHSGKDDRLEYCCVFPASEG